MLKIKDIPIVDDESSNFFCKLEQCNCQFVVRYMGVEQASRRGVGTGGCLVAGNPSKAVEVKKPRTFHGDRNRIKTENYREEKKRKIKEKRKRYKTDGGVKRDRGEVDGKLSLST